MAGSMKAQITSLAQLRTQYALDAVDNEHRVRGSVHTFIVDDKSRVEWTIGPRRIVRKNIGEGTLMSVWVAYRQ